MKNYKKFLGLLAIATLIPMAASCSGKNNNQEGGNQRQNTQTDYSDFEVGDVVDLNEDVTITFYHTMGSTSDYYKTLVNYIGEFEKLYPHITVEESQIGGYNEVRDQVKTELAVGDSPNIAYCYADHVASYNNSKRVIKLDNLLNSTVKLSVDGVETEEQLGFTEAQIADFVEGYYNEGYGFGDGTHMYTLPFLKSTEILYYDKTAFETNGWNVPTTWDEMETLCAQIKQKFPNDTPFGYDSESNWFITMCEQGGYPYTSAQEPNFLFDNDSCKQFVKRFRSWYKSGYVETSSTYGGSYNSGAYTSALFLENGINESTQQANPRSYMCIGSSAGASHQWSDGRFEVGVAEIPQVSTSNKKVISQGPSVCMFYKEDPLEIIASWLFIKYLLTSVEFQAEFSMGSGYVPVIKSVKENNTYKQFLAKANSTSKEGLKAAAANLCVEQADNYFTSPAFIGSSEARDAVGKLLYNSMISNNESEIDGLFSLAVSEAEFARI